jgi:hypothetical protein
MPRVLHGRRALRAQVAHELRSLGSTKDDVARTLETAGVRGRPGNASDCALAVYLSAVVAADPRVRAVYVAPMRVLLTVDGRWWWPRLGVALPKVLRSFVADFDYLRYPELVRTAPGTHVRSAQGTH